MAAKVPIQRGTSNAANETQHELSEAEKWGEQAARIILSKGFKRSEDTRDGLLLLLLDATAGNSKIEPFIEIALGARLGTITHVAVDREGNGVVEPIAVWEAICIRGDRTEVWLSRTHVTH